MDAIITRMDIKQYTGINHSSQITGIPIYLTGFENWYYQFNIDFYCQLNTCILLIFDL